MKDSVIMIPGLGSDTAVWQPTIDALGPEISCRIGNTLSDDSLTAMAGRILDDAPERFALAGVSMGGIVALEMMRTVPERVTRLLLCDTNARADTSEQTAMRRQTNAAMLATDDLAALAQPGIALMVHSSAAEEIRVALTEMTLRVGVPTYVRQNEALIVRNDLRSVLSTIKVPTIVVIGDSDRMTPLPMSQEITDGIQGSTLHVLPECGHLPPIEKPQALAALIRSWMCST